jgi:hypothetical protein
MKVITIRKVNGNRTVKCLETRTTHSQGTLRNCIGKTYREVVRHALTIAITLKELVKNSLAKINQTEKLKTA